MRELVFNRGGTSPRSGVQRYPSIYSPTPSSGRPNLLSEIGNLSDGRGLFLLVKPTGGKLWRCKYRLQGKENLFAIGGFPQVSLAKARATGSDKNAVTGLADYLSAAEGRPFLGPLNIIPLPFIFTEGWTQAMKQTGNCSLTAPFIGLMSPPSAMPTSHEQSYVQQMGSQTPLMGQF